MRGRVATCATLNARRPWRRGYIAGRIKLSTSGFGFWEVRPPEGLSDGPFPGRLSLSLFFKRLILTTMTLPARIRRNYSHVLNIFPARLNTGRSGGKWSSFVSHLCEEHRFCFRFLRVRFERPVRYVQIRRLHQLSPNVTKFRNEIRSWLTGLIFYRKFARKMKITKQRPLRPCKMLFKTSVSVNNV